MPHVTVKNIKLEKGAINDAMPLKAARGNNIANLKFFWGPATPTTVQTRCPFYHDTELRWSNISIFLAMNIWEDPKFYGIFEVRLAHTVWQTSVDSSIRQLA